MPNHHVIVNFPPEGESLIGHLGEDCRCAPEVKTVTKQVSRGAWGRHQGYAERRVEVYHHRLFTESADG